MVTPYGELQWGPQMVTPYGDLWLGGLKMVSWVNPLQNSEKFAELRTHAYFLTYLEVKC